MNIKFTALFAGLFLMGILQCAAQDTSHATVITGKVNIHWSNTLKLSSGPVTLTDAWIDRLNPGDSIIKLDDDGSFVISLSLQKPDFYRLSHESNEVELFLSPTDSIHIDFTAETMVTGSSAAVNQHLKILRGIINTNRKYINSINFFNQSPDEVDTVLDSLQSAYLKVHQKFKETHPVDGAFEQKVLNDITYRNKLYKLVHPPIYKQKTGKRLPVPETYYQDVAQGHFDNPERLKSLDYILFLEEYVIGQSTGEYQFDVYWEAPIERIHPKYDAIQKLNAHQEIKDYLFHQHLNKSIDNYGVGYLADLMPRFWEDCKNPEMLQQVEDRFQAGVERRKAPSEIRIYKRIGNVELEAHIFYPEDFRPGDSRPAYLFFHGGGWAIGIPEWGYKNCERYSAKGMVAISFEYRLIDIHKSNILDCIRDAKSAILWTRKEAESLGIDPSKLVAAGFSAGGHLAAGTAIFDDFEEKDTSGLSSKPNAIVVHSASYNTTKSEWFSKKSNGNPESISTFHQLDKGLVPGIFFHGADDHLAPISEFTEFRDKMDSLGNSYEYKIFENVGHFFNNRAASQEVREMTDAFLLKLGYLQP
ncbi:MAG: alpha/beta hydrolase [Bacteroidota bacterium]